MRAKVRFGWVLTGLVGAVLASTPAAVAAEPICPYVTAPASECQYGGTPSAPSTPGPLEFPFGLPGIG